MKCKKKNKQVKKAMTIAIAGMIISVNMAYANTSEFLKYEVSQPPTHTMVLRVGEYVGKPGKRTVPSQEVLNHLDSTKYPLNADGTLSEYYINKQIALSIQEALKGSQVEVILQDTANRSEDLNAAGRKANTHNADIYLSIHTNSSDNKDAKGFYFLTSTENKKQNSIVEKISTFIANRNSIKKRYNEFDVDYIGELNEINEESTLGMLCEYGFFTNDEDLLLLTDKGYVEEIGEITARAILEALITIE